MVRVGIAGIGFMGVTHFRSYASVPGARVVALADTDPARRAGDWSKVGGNFGASLGQVDLAGIRGHATVEELVADPDVDMVDICLPTEAHPAAAITAMEAGKHVMVEKPIALTLAEADRMLATAERTGRLLMVGHVLRFFPEFALLKEAMDDGRFGALKGLHLKRMAAFPTWMQNPERMGGAAIDLHIHDTDFVRHLFGEPLSVSAVGVVGANGLVDYLVTAYQIAGRDTAVTAQSGWITHRGFEHGYDAYFEAATIVFDSATGKPPLAIAPDHSEREAELPKQDAFVTELTRATAAVARGQADPWIAGASARASLALVLRETDSACHGGTPR